jgi:hypothetical protein
MTDHEVVAVIGNKTASRRSAWLTVAVSVLAVTVLAIAFAQTTLTAPMRAKLREIKEQLRWRMHRPIPEQGNWLGQVVSGYFNYHAVPTNARALDVFRHHVSDL